MPTVEDMIRQYETDTALQKEVAEVLKDGKITVKEFMAFAKKHNVSVSVTEVPKYLEMAKKHGLIQ
jgi:hypothetical protein